MCALSAAIGNLSEERSALAVSTTTQAVTAFALDYSEGAEDMTTLQPVVQENALWQNQPLPGFRYQSNPQEHLAYLKIFFDPRNLCYDPNTVWERMPIPWDLALAVGEVEKNMQMLKCQPAILRQLSRRSAFDLKVALEWVEALAQRSVPHGPLLGWGKMMGHQFYQQPFEPSSHKTFIMVKAPDRDYNKQPSLGLQCFLQGFALPPPVADSLVPSFSAGHLMKRGSAI